MLSNLDYDELINSVCFTEMIIYHYHIHPEFIIHYISGETAKQLLEMEDEVQVEVKKQSLLYVQLLRRLMQK